jgi:hypothetical protein
MHKLCEELRSDHFLSSHPILQASYAHYAFVLIHPFADGNGRVARALASVYTYRSHSIPLMILMENREAYLSSLRAADAGNYQSFVDFIMERALDGIRLVDESLRAATSPSIDEAVENLKRLYTTRGGYTHTEVDQAGSHLLELFLAEIQRQLSELPVMGAATSSAGYLNIEYQPLRDSHRLPVPKGRKAAIQLSLHSIPPAESNVIKSFGLEVPKDCGRNDDLMIRDLGSDETFSARMSEVFPAATAALQMLLKIVVRRILGEAFNELQKRAKESLKKSGY